MDEELPAEDAPIKLLDASVEDDVARLLLELATYSIQDDEGLPLEKVRKRSPPVVRLLRVRATPEVRMSRSNEEIA